MLQAIKTRLKEKRKPRSKTRLRQSRTQEEDTVASGLTYKWTLCGQRKEDLEAMLPSSWATMEKATHYVEASDLQ